MTRGKLLLHSMMRLMNDDRVGGSSVAGIGKDYSSTNGLERLDRMATKWGGMPQGETQLFISLHGNLFVWENCGACQSDIQRNVCKIICIDLVAQTYNYGGCIVFYLLRLDRL